MAQGIEEEFELLRRELVTLEVKALLTEKQEKLRRGDSSLSVHCRAKVQHLMSISQASTTTPGDALGMRTSPSQISSYGDR